MELRQMKDREKDLSEDELLDIYQKAMDYKGKGNVAFSKHQNFEEALIAYEKALELLPSLYTRERAILLNNKCAVKCRLRTSDSAYPTKVEDHPCLRDLNAAIELCPTYSNPYYKRAAIFRRLGDEHLDEALADYKKVIELDEYKDNVVRQVKEHISQLEREIDERNTRLKNEMFAKLKDLGNVCLRPFGLSTNNFKLENNESGGYSIKFNP